LAGSTGTPAANVKDGNGLMAHRTVVCRRTPRPGIRDYHCLSRRHVLSAILAPENGPSRGR